MRRSHNDLGTVVNHNHYRDNGDGSPFPATDSYGIAHIERCALDRARRNHDHKHNSPVANDRTDDRHGCGPATRRTNHGSGVPDNRHAPGNGIARPGNAARQRRL
jgi:hypothetical protein